MISISLSDKLKQTSSPRESNESVKEVMNLFPPPNPSKDESQEQSSSRKEEE